MRGDWLYGPRITMPARANGRDPDYGIVNMRAVELNIETVAETTKLIRSILDQMNVDGAEVLTVEYALRNPSGAPVNETVDEDRLSDLSDYDRGRLGIFLRLLDGGAVAVSFQHDVRPDVTATVQNATMQQTLDLQRQVAEYIVNSGKPLIQWQHLAHLLAYIPAALLVIGTVWLEATTRLPIPGHIIAWAAIIVAAIVTAQAAQRLKTKYRLTWRGHRIRGESRSKTHARRADTRANLKLLAISIPATAIFTFIGSWALFTITHTS